MSETDQQNAFKKLKDAINTGKSDSLNDETYKNLILYYKNLTANCTNVTTSSTDYGKKSKIQPIEGIKRIISDCSIRQVKYLIYAIENEYIDANKFLVWTIAMINTKDKLAGPFSYMNEPFLMTLMLVSLALRYGANPNMYVLEADYGKIHLIVYTLIRLSRQKIYPVYEIDKDFVKQLILIMVLLGSNIQMKAIYPEDNVELTSSNKYNRKILGEATKRSSDSAAFASVNDFIKGVGYDKIGSSLKSANPLGVLDDIYENPKLILKRALDMKEYEFVVRIGFCIDDPEFTIIKGKGMELMPSFEEILKYNAIRTLQHAKIDDNDPQNSPVFRSESIRVIQTIECICLEAFVELLQRGFKMSYFTMNRLILKLQESIDKSDGRKKFDRVYSEVYISMIRSAIALGVPMDNYQFEFIKNLSEKDSSGTSLETLINDTYKIPLWKKACGTSIKAKLPKTVKLYTASLGIGDDPSAVGFNNKEGRFDFMQPSKMEICSALSIMMSKPEEEIKKEAMDRLRRRIEITTPKVSDLVTGRYTVAECSNTGEFYGNPLDYNDATLAYYRDSKENLYCFPSSMYKELLESRTNPYTDEALPNDLLIKMDKTRLIFETLSIDMDKTVPVSVAFKKLNQNDTINNERTDYAKETITMLFYSRGIRKEWIESQSYDTYNNILQIPDINMRQDYLKELDKKPIFKYATFCKALYSGIKKLDSISRIPYVMGKIIDVLKAPVTAKSATTSP